MQPSKLLGTGIIAAFASSLCCIAPLLAIFGGITGAASALSWVEPLRPYLMILAAGSLGFAFYQAYRPKKAEDCCEGDECKTENRSFLNSKGFLWTITFMSILLFTFPYYSGAFISDEPNIESTDIEESRNMNLAISGMTCVGCSNTIQLTLKNTEGIIDNNVSYEDNAAYIEYDAHKISKEDIIQKITDLGYTASLLTKTDTNGN